MILTGSEVVDQIFSVLLSTHMFIGGLTGFILDNTVPGISHLTTYLLTYLLIKKAAATCLSSRAVTVELGDAVTARCSVIARMTCAVVDVNATVDVRPAVDAEALESAVLVDARSAIPARIRHHTLVHVFRTVATYNCNHSEYIYSYYYQQYKTYMFARHL